MEKTASTKNTTYTLVAIALMTAVICVLAPLSLPIGPVPISMATLVLFFATGAIVFRTGYTRVSELRGIGRKLPGMLLLFTLASFVIMGIPPTLGFVGDWNVSLGALAVHIPYLASVGSCVFVIGELFAAGYLMGIMIRGFFPGEDYHSDSEEAIKPSLFMRLPAVLLTMAVYIIGFYPVPLLELIQRALEAMAI